ncbi:MAG: isochorismatase [Chloroflexi bacterium]|nr:MAG: isochorismatase [Chloroflexota bacterium]
MSNQFTLHLRSWELTQDAGGHNQWQEKVVTRQVNTPKTAIIICDMWDKHWSRGASERVDAMAPRMNQVIAAARAKGALIIHAPSDTMDFYAAVLARQRILAVPPVEPPPPLDHTDPPLPIDDSDEGSDTGETTTFKAWSRQHPALAIDQAHDFISDNGGQVYSILQQQGIDQVLIMGVHTNMCVLRRSFAIKQMVKWGVNIALVRDLTDTMYNPAMPPYVSHDEGTRLVVEYIEKFWCPSIVSEDLVMRNA